MALGQDDTLNETHVSKAAHVSVYTESYLHKTNIHSLVSAFTEQDILPVTSFFRYVIAKNDLLTFVQVDGEAQKWR